MYQAYDIRGVYPKEINATSTIFLSRKFFEFLKKKQLPTKVLLAFDARPSSAFLGEVFTRVFPGQIENIGLVPVPLYYHLVLKRKLPGVMITASHLPQRYNGFKFFLPTNEMWVYQKDIPTANAASQRSHSSKLKPEIKPELYLDYLKTLKRLTNFAVKAKIKFNSPTSLNRYVFKLLPKVFPTISLTPTAPWQLVSDLDGDRLFFYWRGQKLLPEHVLNLVLQNSPYQKIGLTANLSQQIAKQFPGKEFITIKTGHKNFKEAYRKIGIDFGFESSHHFHFFKDLRTEAPILGLLKVLQTTAQLDLDKFLKQSKLYLWRFNVKLKPSRVKLLDDFLERFWGVTPVPKTELHLKKFDGLEIKHSTFRLHLRQSNTEAKVRFFLEARNQVMLTTLKNIIKKLAGLQS